MALSNIQPPEVLARITRDVIPHCYLVGGCVRDAVLGRKPKDWDIECFDISTEELEQLLKPFGKVDAVGRSFGVLKLYTPDKQDYDFSVARTERKIEGESGHRAFVIEPNPSLSPKEASLRRDFTINALMWNPKTNELLDFHGGLKHLQEGVLRHTSDRFSEDPLRPLRLMQFAGRFGFSVAPETLELCQTMLPEAASLPKERVREEWLKWATKSTRPSAGLEALRQSGWIKLYPELSALIDCPQDPEWHPEGDVWAHTKHVCDAMAQLPEWKASDTKRKAVLMFGSLCHDLGKPACTGTKVDKNYSKGIRIVSPGHDRAGVEPTESFFQRMLMPREYVAPTVCLVREHMAHLTHNNASQVRRLAVRMKPSSIADLAVVVEADHSGRPPLPKHQPEAMVKVVEIARREQCLAHSQQPILKGEYLLTLGLPSGPGMGIILREAYEAQLDGRFKDLTGATEWYRNSRAKILSNAGQGPVKLLTAAELGSAGIPPGPRYGRILNLALEWQFDNKNGTRNDLLSHLEGQGLLDHQEAAKLRPSVAVAQAR